MAASTPGFLPRHAHLADSGLPDAPRAGFLSRAVESVLAARGLALVGEGGERQRNRVFAAGASKRLNPYL